MGIPGISCTILLFLFAGQFHTLYAQSKLGRLFKRPDYDSLYVESYYDDFVHVTLLSNSLNHSLDVFNTTDNLGVSYKPNNTVRFGAGIDYRFLSLEYTHSWDLVDAPDPGKGNTNSTSLRLGVTGRRCLASVLIQRIKGMYVSNPDEVIAGGYSLPTVVRGDLLSEVFLGSLNYFFSHHHYSTMASLWQIDRQKKPAGSFATGITMASSHIRADSSLLPLSRLRTTGDAERIIENYTYLVGVNFGYAYNYVHNSRWFLSGMFIPGLNVQYGYNTVVGEVRHNYRSTFGYHGDLRIVAGYNGIRYYGGAYYANYFNSGNLQTNVDVNLYNTYFRFFIGRRFELITRRKNR